MTTTPVDPVVEMLVNNAWVDITADCRLESADSGGGFEIHRGVPNEGNDAEPTTFNFTLNNGASKVTSTLGQTGCYSPRNPLGPYYGLLGRNQRVRIGLNRRVDTFNRTAVAQGLGSVPSKIQADGVTVVPPSPWRISVPAAGWSTNGTEAIIAGGGLNKYALTDDVYADVDLKMRVKCSTRDTEFGFMLRTSPDYITPPVGAVDGTFEAGLGTWAPTGTNIASLNTVNPHSGSQCAQVTVAGSPATVAFATPIGVTTLWSGRGGALVEPGGTYMARMWVRTSVNLTVNGLIRFYDENLVFLGSIDNGGTACLANTWTLIEATGQSLQDAAYARPGPVINGSPANGITMLVDDVELYMTSGSSWYSVNLVPGGTDQVKIGKVALNTSNGAAINWDQTLVINTYYWMRAQVAGQRIRMKAWKDGDPEPTGWYLRRFDDNTVSEGMVGLTGGVGFFCGPGTGTLTVDSFEINQWRAHTEIAELPPRWDLARVDKWVPISSKGILRRLGQGRKDIKSAVSQHLNAYASLTKAWWPLEGGTGIYAGNNVATAGPASILNLTFNTPDLSGNAAFPGVSGFATLDQANSYFLGSVPNHTLTGKETFLFFVKYPALPASDTVLATITSTGTARKWVITALMLGDLRVDAYNSAGTLLGTSSSLFYFNPEHPVGCWLACTLYLQQSGGNINWAFNFHKPGEPSFWTINGVFAGTLGIYTGIQFRSNSVWTTAGNLSITQVMHYAGDLPFVTADFERAAYAYNTEIATLRFLRLGANANVPVTTTGYSLLAEPMGFQLPDKLIPLMQDCADTEHGIFQEDRDDFGLVLVTRDSLWNRVKHPLSVDAGHLTAPLEPSDDDKGTRNDVTLKRVNGSFSRSIQLTGPLNVSPPEIDPVNGVGIYDEAPERNFAADTQTVPGADWRRSRGTQDEARYPSIHADLTSTAYQVSPALAAATRGIDAGDIIDLSNSEVSFDSAEQQVQSYTETIDLFDYDITWVAVPARVYRVGVVGITTRADTENSVTNASFISGTNTKLQVTRVDATLAQWMQPQVQPDAFPFNVDVNGVRLKVVTTGDMVSLNPTFDTDLTGWVASTVNANIVADRFNPKYGFRCCRVTCTLADTTGVTATQAGNAPVVVGASYLVSGWMRAAVATADARVAVDWYLANGTGFISTTLPTPIALVANTWTYYSAVVVAPATSAFARVKMRAVMAINDRIWVDQLSVIAVASYTTDPQTLTVEQAPVNGVAKTIASGKKVRLADPWRPAW